MRNTEKLLWKLELSLKFNPNFDGVSINGSHVDSEFFFFIISFRILLEAGRLCEYHHSLSGVDSGQEVSGEQIWPFDGRLCTCEGCNENADPAACIRGVTWRLQ